MLEAINHFGVTVSEQGRSRNFYARALRLPWMAETTNSGARLDRMHRLDGVINRITWYQIGAGGMETFHLPRHASPRDDAGDINRPGYRYIAFFVRGFDNYIARLRKSGLNVQLVESRGNPCAHVSDPDGIHVLLFDTGRDALAGHVSGLKEIGLVVSQTCDYEKFFETLGLWQLERDCDFLDEFFGVTASAPLFGRVRLICLPENSPAPSAQKSAHASAPNAPFSEVGIKHVAYCVENVDSFYKHGLDAGIPFLFEPLDVPGGSRIAYFLDPEGNTFEAMQLNPAMQMAARAAGALKQASLSISANAPGKLRRT
ncbi:MAG: VOC family protein [bacterium]